MKTHRHRGCIVDRYLGRGRASYHSAVPHLNSIASRSCCESIMACYDACNLGLQVILLVCCSVPPATRLVS